MMADASLRDRRVLVVEDEYMIAEAMSRDLRRAGATVLGPVSDVAGALALLDDEADVDAAVLDINLGDHKVYPVVDVLLARGAQCVFATGNDPADVPTAYAAMTRLEKPVDPASIVHVLNGRGPYAEPRRGSDPLAALTALRDQLTLQIRVAGDAGETLLAAKLSEAFDVADHALRR
ncbi:hypothetical protein LPN01_15765 [Sphingomonas sp. A2-49]|uniref:response regulator n=1 Tax=Sphingomonas sp. A2-49 TaxID=1391375 RepID=UPI0021CE2FF0|nr:hypothetical protein [Sphingomonas sp. A2-49]MCU6455536.1 hypothetical protein [Sphingomonas sp. A2-49]